MLNFEVRSMASFGTVWYTAMVVFFLKGAASSIEKKALKQGDVNLGGLFPIHKSAQEDNCSMSFKEGVILTEAMIHAIEVVNNSTLLRHGITLGYDIRDTCNSVITALKASLDFVNEKTSRGQMENITSHYLTRKPVAVIGAGNSEISSAVNNIFSIFKVPQIGYASTSRVLSNKKLYPTFLRTVPPDSHQGLAIAKIVSHFQWNFVALLALDNIYGRPLAETFKAEVKKFGVCLAMDILIPYNPTKSKIAEIVGKIHQDKNIGVILLFTSEKEAIMILDEAAKQNISRRLWIASDSWADSPKIAEDHAEVVDGMLRIINQPTVVPNFMKYFYRLTPSTNSHNPWFGEFWEKIFHCNILKKNFRLPKAKSSQMKNCSGKERLSSVLQDTDALFSRVSYVFDAVFSVAYSIKEICERNLSTKSSEGIYDKDIYVNRVTPSSVLSHIFNVTFQSVTNHTVSFDSDGDANGHYDIINFRKDGLITTFLTVGKYNGKTGSLNFQNETIHWPGGTKSPPFGRCSVECSPGTYKVILKPVCCWICKPCPAGSVSNASGVCTQCQWGKIPNRNKTKCVVIPVIFLRWESAWAWSLIGTIILCESLCVFTVVVFLRYKETPIVKAANREISFLLLFGLLAGFLIPLAYIGRPTDINCKIQAILFGASFSFSLSMILARINRTVVVFRYSKVTPRKKSKFLRRYLGLFLYNRTQIMLALFFTVLELLLCFVWLLSSPPRVTLRRLTISENLAMCEVVPNFGHIASNAFIIFLSLLCTFVAFKSRKLPQNYNEAKFISFAMFVFNCIWLTFVGAFYGTPDGYHNVIINCFAIIASNFAIFALVFGPKLYIIIFRPSLNQMQVFRALTARYTFRSSRRSSALTSGDMMGSSYVMKENKYVQTCSAMNSEESEIKGGPFTCSGTPVNCDAQPNKAALKSTQKPYENVLLKEVHICKLCRPNRRAASDSALNRPSEDVGDLRTFQRHLLIHGGCCPLRTRRDEVSHRQKQPLNDRDDINQENCFAEDLLSLTDKEKFEREENLLDRISYTPIQANYSLASDSMSNLCLIPLSRKKLSFCPTNYQINCKYRGIKESHV